MARKIGPVLAEILAAIDGIEQASRGKALRDFEQEWLLKHGVQRGIGIISEASRHIPESLRDAHQEIPWKRIIGIGSVLRHEYHRIANPVVWTVVTEYLPALKRAVLAMKAEIREWVLLVTRPAPAAVSHPAGSPVRHCGPARR